MKDKKKILQIIAAVMVFLVLALAIFGIVRYVLREEVTVSSVKALQRAVKKDRIKKINFISDKELVVDIPAGTYSNKEIAVYAPNATINNYGTFKIIKVYSLDNGKWNEYTRGNKIYATTQTFSINIGKTAIVDELYLSNDRMRSLVYVEGSICAVYAYGDNVVTISGTTNNKVNVYAKSSEVTIKDADGITVVTNNSEGEVKIATDTGILLVKPGDVLDNTIRE